MKKRAIGILVTLMMIVNFLPAMAATNAYIYSYTESGVVSEVTLKLGADTVRENFAFQYEGEYHEIHEAVWQLTAPSGTVIPEGTDNTDQQTEIWYDGTANYTRLSFPPGVETGVYTLKATVNNDVATLRINLLPSEEKAVRITDANGRRFTYDNDTYYYPEYDEVSYKTKFFNAVNPVVTWKLVNGGGVDVTSQMLKNASNSGVTVYGNPGTSAGRYILTATATDRNQTFIHEIDITINRSDAPAINLFVNGKEPVAYQDIIVDLKNGPQTYTIVAKAVSQQSGNPVNCQMEWMLHPTGFLPLTGVSTQIDNETCVITVSEEAIDGAAFSINVSAPLYNSYNSLYARIINGAKPQYSIELNMDNDFISINPEKPSKSPFTTLTKMNNQPAGLHHRMLRPEIKDSDGLPVDWSQISVEFYDDGMQNPQGQDGHMAPAEMSWLVQVNPEAKPGRYTLEFIVGIDGYDNTTGEYVFNEYCRATKDFTVSYGETITYGAQIGNKKYVSLKDAVADVKNNDNIVLLKDCSGEGKILISKEVCFTVTPFENTRYILGAADVFKDVSTQANKFDVKMKSANVHKPYTENLVEYKDGKTTHDKSLAKEYHDMIAATANIIGSKDITDAAKLQKRFDRDISDKQTATDMLRRIPGNENITDDEIVFAAQPFMKVKVVDAIYVDETNTARPQVTLDISPRLSTVMTTKAAFEGGNLSTDENDGYNAVLVGYSDEVKIDKPVRISLPVPYIFCSLSENQKIYVTHKTKSGISYVYETTIVERVIEFTNPHGFSEFTISVENPIIAKTGDVAYPGMRDAVTEAKTGSTVEIVKAPQADDSKIKITDKSLTFINNTAQDITLTINGTDRIIAKNGGTYTESPSINNISVAVDSFDLTENALNISVSVAGITENATLYTVLYDNNGKLLGLAKNAVDKDTTKSVTLNHNFKNNEMYIVHAMLWNDMQPLCEKAIQRIPDVK